MTSYRVYLLFAIRELYELEDYCKEHENDVDFDTKKVKFSVQISNLDHTLFMKTIQKEWTDGYLKTGIPDTVTEHKTWARYPNGVTGPKILADQKRLVKIAMRIENILVMEKNLIKNYINAENRSMNLFESFYKIYDSGKNFEDHTPKSSSFLRQKINIAFMTMDKDKSMQSKVLEEIFDEFRSSYDHENDYDNYIPPFVLNTPIQKAKDDIRRAWQVINEKPRSEFTDIKPFDLRMIEEGEKVMDRFVENQELIKQKRFSDITWKIIMRERLIGLKKLNKSSNVEFIDDRKPTREFEPIDVKKLKKQWSKK